MENQIAKRAYSTAEFYAAFGVGKTFTFQEIAAGRLKAKKLGKKILILAEDAEAWAASLPDSRPTEGAEA